MTDPLDMRHLCAGCGTDITGKRSDVLYCSRSCWDAAYKHLCKLGRLEDKANRPPCQNCGAAIPATALVTAIYCSRSCKHEARNRRVGLAFKAARSGRACAVCGGSLDHRRKDALYCGTTCYESAKWQRRRARSQTTD